jgi:RHS repeat-associated protein
MIQETLPDLSVIHLTYDGNGNVTSITSPRRLQHQFFYNMMNLLDEYLPPVLPSVTGVETTYRYNFDKQLAQISRPDGTNIYFYYNPSTPSTGLLSQIQTPTGNYTYTYYPNTNLIASLTSPYAEVLSYHYVGNLPTSVTSSGSVSSYLGFTYNPDSTVASIGVGANATSATPVNLSYDKDGLLIGSGDEKLTINSQGAVSASALGNISESLKYNPLGQMVQDSFSFSTQQLLLKTISRDKLGRIIGVTEGTKNLTYVYDPAGTLKSVTQNGFLLRAYTYDSNGNRISASGPGLKVTAQNAQYDSQDRLLAYGPLQFQYDFNGTLTSKIDNSSTKQQITKYTYDAFGNLKTVILPDGRQIDYIIDGQNRRVGKKVNGQLVQMYAYQSQTQLAAILNPQGQVIQRFVYGAKANVPDYMIAGGIEYRIISNQVGTPELVVNSSSGTIVETLSFDEFGVPGPNVGSQTIPIGFAGGLRDSDTGLVRFGARDYDPETGRFVSKDPILFDGGDTNLYSYGLQDPINHVDPTGLYCTYSQSSGSLICIDATTGIPYLNTTGFSGNGLGTNQPAFQNVPNIGPIPSGTYTVGPPNGALGPNTRPLVPDTLANFPSLRDPNSFFLHGGTESHGCVINNNPGNRSVIPTGETFIVVQ